MAISKRGEEAEQREGAELRRYSLCFVVFPYREQIACVSILGADRSVCTQQAQVGVHVAADMRVGGAQKEALTGARAVAGTGTHAGESVCSHGHTCTHEGAQ